MAVSDTKILSMEDSNKQFEIKTFEGEMLDRSMFKFYIEFKGRKSEHFSRLGHFIQAIIQSILGIPPTFMWNMMGIGTSWRERWLISY
jgi:hypothetical protein